MLIRDMFEKDINRKIGGVVKVDQDSAAAILQEVDEYVITKELKKHFMSFFDYYSETYDEPTDDIGIWISGFFGSGKSHFLKMLSYILENKVVGGIPTVERFREKFKDDPATFMLIDNSVRHETKTILFNIDVEGSVNKDKTAVLRVFAKVFYDYLGYCGDNLKVAMLEQYIDEQGKTEEFRRVFEEKKGKPWVQQRRAFAFNGKSVVPTLMEVLDMSEEDAKKWFDDKSAVDFSIADLVRDIKAYMDKKPEDFRLVFMADEVGQYVGEDRDMLLNLQSIVEKIGSECGGRVWVACTGQEAIDEIIKVRADEFSRIQARFKTRLSLSSSSVDEVIQKRILKKTPEAENRLEDVYAVNDAGLRNLFSFKDCILDIKGFGSSDEFSANYPFVPYQFIIIQKVFAEIRKHGNSGKHLSGGERSMLSGFQEAAQKIEERDEYALAPFFLFYDTVHSFLDGSIRRVIERCERAALSGDGIEARDVDVLKLLYLIRYVDDIPACIDNIVILMADDIRADKIIMREEIGKSLERLLAQNYIGRDGEKYNFLTDEEQDIARGIRDTFVDTSAIVAKIGEKIFGDIYTSKKFRYGIYDFPFDEMVDWMAIGARSGGMCLKFLTEATDDVDKTELRLMTGSKGQAIVVLPRSSYYDSIENALKIRTYVKQRNVHQLPKSVQQILRDQQEEADRYEASALEALKSAIESASFYVDGERLPIKGGDAKSKINEALEYLVGHIYSGLDLITKNAASDTDIFVILRGDEKSLPGTEENRDAAAKMEEYLEVQSRNHRTTSMADVQSRYQAIPYGWREIDVAAVAAQLIYDQKVTVKYAGNTVQPSDPKLPDMLRKKSEIGKTAISKRISPSAQKMRTCREFMREYFDVMDVPDDENGLIAFIIEKFTGQREHYAALDEKYDVHKYKYPDRPVVKTAINLVDDVLSQKKDNIALIDRLVAREDALYDSKEDMQRVEGFFENQVQVFDEAAKLLESLHDELDYLSREPEADAALNRIRLICSGSADEKFDYRKIPELNGLIAEVNAGHDRLLKEKREEILEYVRQCMEAVHSADSGDGQIKDIIRDADAFYDGKKQQIAGLTSLALLDSQVPVLLRQKDDALEKIERVQAASAPTVPGHGDDIENASVAPKKVYKTFNRSIVFPSKRLETPDDIDAYLDKVREMLLSLLDGGDGIELK